jgi:hypothetical protein
MCQLHLSLCRGLTFQHGGLLPHDRSHISKCDIHYVHMQLSASDCATRPATLAAASVLWRAIPLGPPPFLSRIPAVYNPALAGPLWAHRIFIRFMSQLILSAVLFASMFSGNHYVSGHQLTVNVLPGPNWLVFGSAKCHPDFLDKSMEASLTHEPSHRADDQSTDAGTASDNCSWQTDNRFMHTMHGDRVPLATISQSVFKLNRFPEVRNLHQGRSLLPTWEDHRHLVS